MKSDRPSLLRILITDYTAFMAALFPIVMWAVFFFERTTDQISLFYTGIGITVVAVPILLWRIYFFIKLFDTGIETPAVITGMSFYRSRGRVDFSYTYQGAQYSARDVIFKIGRVKDIVPTQEVTVLVDPNKPKRAIIKKLYL